MINSLMTILGVEFIYGSVESIAGWSKQEMMILICTSLIVNQLFRGMIHFNQNRFVNGVGTGGFDKLLLRPLNLLFQVNTGQMHIASLLSILAPVVILFMQLHTLEAQISVARVGLYLLFIFNGVLILASFMLLLYTLAFVFIKVDGINNVYYLMMDIANKPQEMFGKEFLYGFLFIIPAIPLANAPASVLLGRSNGVQLAIYLGIGLVFFSLSAVAMNKGRKRYTSASS
jgi:ABC-2 type transport system permease protein